MIATMRRLRAPNLRRNGHRSMSCSEGRRRRSDLTEIGLGRLAASEAFIILGDGNDADGVGAIATKARLDNSENCRSASTGRFGALPGQN